MYRLLSLPNESETAERCLDGADNVATPPDYEEWYEERRVQYSKIGLTAFALTQELRKKYGIPAQEFDYWNPAERLAEAKARVDTERAKQSPFPPPSPPLVRESA